MCITFSHKIEYLPRAHIIVSGTFFFKVSFYVVMRELNVGAGEERTIYKYFILDVFKIKIIAKNSENSLITISQFVHITLIFWLKNIFY